MARLRSASLALLATAGGWLTASARAQDATTTTDSSPLYTITVPAKTTQAPPTPTPGPAPSGATASAAAALPRQLASTGTDPLLIVAAGLGAIALSLLARRAIRARLGEG